MKFRHKFMRFMIIFTTLSLGFNIYFLQEIASLKLELSPKVAAAKEINDSKDSGINILLETIDENSEKIKTLENKLKAKKQIIKDLQDALDSNTPQEAQATAPQTPTR